MVLIVQGERYMNYDIIWKISINESQSFKSHPIRICQNFIYERTPISRYSQIFSTVNLINLFSLRCKDLLSYLSLLKMFSSICLTQIYGSYYHGNYGNF